MEENYKEFLQFVENNKVEYEENFNYKQYILPHNDMRELLGKIIEDLQCLEARLNHLAMCAYKSQCYGRKIKFNFDNRNSTSNIIKELKGKIIDDKNAEKLLVIIRFRNYIIHSYYLHKNRNEVEKVFPTFLCIIYEVCDYIDNLINILENNDAVHIPNIFDDKPNN